MEGLSYIPIALETKFELTTSPFLELKSGPHYQRQLASAADLPCRSVLLTVGSPQVSIRSQILMQSDRPLLSEELALARKPIAIVPNPRHLSYLHHSRSQICINVCHNQMPHCSCSFDAAARFRQVHSSAWDQEVMAAAKESGDQEIILMLMEKFDESVVTDNEETGSKFANGFV